MARQFIDISVPLENDVISDLRAFNPKISYIDHQMSVDRMTAFFPGLTGMTCRTAKAGRSRRSS